MGLSVLRFCLFLCVSFLEGRPAKVPFSRFVPFCCVVAGFKSLLFLFLIENGVQYYKPESFLQWGGPDYRVNVAVACFPCSFLCSFLFSLFFSLFLSCLVFWPFYITEHLFTIVMMIVF